MHEDDTDRHADDDDDLAFLDSIDKNAQVWISLSGGGLVHVGGMGSSKVFGDIIDGVDDRQIRFREDGTYTIDVTFSGKLITANLNGAAINMPSSRWARESLSSPTHVLFRVSCKKGDVLTFSEAPISRVVINKLS